MQKQLNYLPVIVLAGALLLRLALTNINAAEWGDSYRILRAGNFIQHLSYPSDEKRPPLFSALLAPRPAHMDGVVWGRLVMLGITFAAYFVFYKLCRKMLLTKRQAQLALIFLILNPVYLYWSLRIYADLFFSLLVMLNFYIFELWSGSPPNKKQAGSRYLVLMGVICGLSILTRFEGYLLTAALVAGVAIKEQKPLGGKVKSAILFLAGTLGTVTPWLIYRNPLTSSYFEEPAGRTYDLNMLLTYLISYLFVLGVIPAASFMVAYLPSKIKKEIPAVVKRKPHLAMFILLESLLILAWPAAVPRLFIPVIPLLIIAFARKLEVISSENFTKPLIVFSIGLSLGYFILQNKLRLQFLGPHTAAFLSVILISLVGAMAILIKNRRLFLASSVTSMLLLSLTTIYLHKDVYRSIKDISTFPLREPHGNIIHNDTAGIVNWYVPGSEYKNLDDKKYLSLPYLLENNINYIVITNEFNPTMEIDLNKRPYLELLTKSEYERGGKMFYTWLVKVQK